MPETQTPQSPPSGNGPTEKKRKHRRKAPPPAAIVHLDFETSAGFELAQRRATALAVAGAVPEIFQGPVGSKGWGNAMIALELAHRTGFPVLLVMQNMTLIEGRPGWQGKFFIALIEARNKFKDHGWEVRDEPAPGRGPLDTYGMRMHATRISDGNVCHGQWVTVAMAKAEGWWSKKSRDGKEWSKWPTMTAQMLVYRSASFWASQWDPGATMGLRTVEELEDQAEQVPRLVAPLAPPITSGPAAPPPAPDRPLESGVDPPSMGVAGEPEELKLVRKLLADGHRREAVEAIKRLPAHLQKAGADIYSAAPSK